LLLLLLLLLASPGLLVAVPHSVPHLVALRADLVRAILLVMTCFFAAFADFFVQRLFAAAVRRRMPCAAAFVAFFFVEAIVA